MPDKKEKKEDARVGCTGLEGASGVAGASGAQGPPGSPGPQPHDFIECVFQRGELNVLMEGLDAMSRAGVNGLQGSAILVNLADKVQRFSQHPAQLGPRGEVGPSGPTGPQG